MPWEIVPLRGGTVTVSWRKPGGKGAGRQISVTISSGVCVALGLRRGHRIVAHRDRMAGKLLLRPVLQGADGARAVHWRKTRDADVAQIFVPMPDLRVDENKAAQTVRHEITPEGLVLKLPPWACPLIQVSGGRAA